MPLAPAVNGRAMMALGGTCLVAGLAFAVFGSGSRTVYIASVLFLGCFLILVGMYNSMAPSPGAETEAYTVKDPEGRAYTLRVIEDDAVIGAPIRMGQFWEAHFQPKFKEYAEASLRPGDVILDIGANIGSHSVYLANFADVYAFEPQDSVLQVLRWNAANNQLAHRIHVQDFGLYSETKTLNMNPVAKNDDGSLNHGGTGIRPSLAGEVQPEAGEQVRVRKFDEFWSRHMHPRVGFIKIDIEGGEVEALRGMTEMLRRDWPLIQFEDWGDAHPNGLPRPKDVLEPLGYVIRQIDSHNWLAVPPRLAQRF